MGGSVSTTAKQIFLKYYKQNREFLLDEAETDALWTDMLAEINCLPDPAESGETKRSWKELLPDWTNEVREKFKNSIENESSEMVYLSSEDFQLINMDCLDIEASLMPIMKYLEEVEVDSLKELLDRIQSTDMTLQEWEIELMDYLKRLIHKKKLYDYNRPHFILEHTINDEMKDFFTTPELKLISLISDSDYKSLGLDNRFKIEICRVCCHHKPMMLDIFSSGPDGMSLASKIGMCVELPPIEEQDTLPKSICHDCAEKLGTCFEFQKLCRESDYELRRDKTLRDMIMEQVLDKTMGSAENMNIGNDVWNNTGDITKGLESVPMLLLGVDNKAVDHCATSNISDTSSSLGTAELMLLHSAKHENCDIRKYQCEICGARFFDIYNFKTHWRIHKIHKKYECSVCGKKFRTNVMLKIHLRTHTNERPFSCDTCHKTFKTASAVTSHQAVHATVKAFKCELCPYEGTTKPNLRIHMRTHSKEQPYLCKQCGKRFSTASNLLKHSRNIHQRLKTNNCPLCEKKFFSRESARKHLITHTVCKPYDCKHCPSVTYSWYSGLEKHYQKYHKRLRMPAESSFKGRVDKALTESLRGVIASSVEVKVVARQSSP